VGSFDLGITLIVSVSSCTFLCKSWERGEAAAEVLLIKSDAVIRYQDFNRIAWPESLKQFRKSILSLRLFVELGAICVSAH